MDLSGLRVAVVHDWLTGMRGGEKVLEAILELTPGADVYTLFHLPGTVSNAIESHRIITSPLQRFSSLAGDYRRLLPFYPAAVASWNLAGYDLVVSSSHCVAKGVDPAGAPHVCYCHTPMRYIWDRFDDYFPPERPVLRLVAGVLARFLRRWDVETASRVDRWVANSEFVRGRIRLHYGAGATVVHPFVDDAYLATALGERRDDYHLVVSALVPYKRIEVAIDAAAIAKRRLVVIGDGPYRGNLEARAAGRVEFLGRRSDDELRDWMGRARSLLYPGVEDFGITAIEAMACGTPVVARAEGGALDSVVDGVTGVLSRGADARTLAAAMIRSETLEWNREAIREHAASFSRERFKARMMSEIELAMGDSA
ncbi:MAG: glycosyltransferase [Thermoanaerobaculia bacterium]